MLSCFLAADAGAAWRLICARGAEGDIWTALGIDAGWDGVGGEMGDVLGC